MFHVRSCLIPSAYKSFGFPRASQKLVSPTFAYHPSLNSLNLHQMSLSRQPAELASYIIVASIR